MIKIFYNSRSRLYWYIGSLRPYWI